MPNSMLAWANAIKTATLAASSAEGALPVSNLANDQGAPSAGWQTLAGALTGVLLTITPAARATFRAFGAFRTNLSNAGTLTVRAYTNPGPVLLGTWSGTFANGQCVAIAPSDQSADYVTFTFADSGNPDNHLNIPLAYAGPAWFPLTAMSWASTYGRDDITDIVVSRGGQQYVNLRASSKRWEIALDGVRGSEAFSQLDVLDRVSRVGGNVLVVPNQASANMQGEAAYGLLKATADVSFPLGAGDRRSWRARLTERL